MESYKNIDKNILLNSLKSNKITKNIKIKLTGSRTDDIVKANQNWLDQ